jgi:hypothetical protein
VVLTVDTHRSVWPEIYVRKWAKQVGADGRPRQRSWREDERQTNLYARGDSDAWRELDSEHHRIATLFRTQFLTAQRPGVEDAMGAAQPGIVRADERWHRASVEARADRVDDPWKGNEERTGVPENFIPKVLNHVEPGVTRRHDNLHAYRGEKRAALETWARYLEAILANKQPTATVVAFRRSPRHQHSPVPGSRCWFTSFDG